MKKIVFFFVYRFILPIFLLVFSLQTFANPPEIIKYFGNKQPLGTGSISNLLFKLYDVTVWTKGNHFNWHEPFALYLTYARNFSSQQIIDATISEIKRINHVDPTTATHYTHIFSQLFPDVNPGDTISAIYLPGKSLIFFYNNHKNGAINDMGLAKKFLNIWLSKQARYPIIRKQILNQN